MQRHRRKRVVGDVCVATGATVASRDCDARAAEEVHVVGSNTRRQEARAVDVVELAVGAPGPRALHRATPPTGFALWPRASPGRGAHNGGVNGCVHICVSRFEEEPRPPSASFRFARGSSACTPSCSGWLRMHRAFSYPPSAGLLFCSKPRGKALGGTGFCGAQDVATTESPPGVPGPTAYRKHSPRRMIAIRSRPEAQPGQCDEAGRPRQPFVARLLVRPAPNAACLSGWYERCVAGRTSGRCMTRDGGERLPCSGRTGESCRCPSCWFFGGLG